MPRLDDCSAVHALANAWSHGAGEVVVEIEVLGPGEGFSGIVVERGAGFGPTVGDEVLGILPAGQRAAVGGVCPCALALKPAGLLHAEAAVLAGAGPLALRAIRLCGAVARDRVLISDAGGEIGALAVQVAKVRGWTVTALCRERDMPLVWELGADQVHPRDRPPGVVGRYVAVIDTDDSISPQLAHRLLEPRGRLIAIRGDAIHVSAAGGAPLGVHRSSPADEVDLSELVDLVEREGVYPAPRGPRPSHLDRVEVRRSRSPAGAGD